LIADSCCTPVVDDARPAEARTEQRDLGKPARFCERDDRLDVGDVVRKAREQHAVQSGGTQVRHEERIADFREALRHRPVIVQSAEAAGHARYIDHNALRGRIGKIEQRVERDFVFRIEQQKFRAWRTRFDHACP
jgi:hypothetical protein